MIWISLMIAMNLTVCCHPCKHDITIHRSSKTIYISAKREMGVNMALYNLIGNRVYDWGTVKLSKGISAFDCSRIMHFRGIYILLLDGENIQFAKKMIISA